MSLQLVVTLTFLAVLSSHAYPQLVSQKAQKFLSQLLPAQYISNPQRHPLSQDENNEKGFDESDDDSSVKSERRISPNFPPLIGSHGDDVMGLRESFNMDNMLPVYTNEGQSDLSKLRADRFLALAKSVGEDEEEDSIPRSLSSSELMAGRGKRYIPGLNSLLMARLLNNRRSRILDAGKWKRQPHLGFHGSRG